MPITSLIASQARNEHGGKDTIENLITLCKPCHKKVHRGKLKLDVEGVSGFKDQIAQRTMQGKAYLYETLSQQAPLSKVFGYQTSAYRKSLSLPKTHDIDALCVATCGLPETDAPTGEVIPQIASGLLRSSQRNENFYVIKFRPRQTRRQFHDLPRKGVGRVRYQVNAQSLGFRKGDIVRVKGKWVKQINSIYSNGYLAFGRVSGEPNVAKPKDLKLLKRGQIASQARNDMGKSHPPYQRGVGGLLIFNVWQEFSIFSNTYFNLHEACYFFQISL